MASQKIRHEVNITAFHHVYYFEQSKDFFHLPERHNHWEMLYVDKGKIIAITNGIGCVLEQGQAIFHEPGEVHAHISDRKNANNMLVVSFSVDSCDMDFFKKKTFTFDKTARTLLSLFMQEAQNALGKLPGDYNDRSEVDFSGERFGSAQLMQGYFSEFLIKLIRNGAEAGDRFYANSESRSLADNNTVALIMEHLEQNVYGSVTLNDLCEHFFIGKSQLNVIFHEYTGKSPMHYYTELKIKEAKKLLREGNYSVGEIGEMLGYSGIHNFSRAFKNLTGFSPMKYKKSVIS